MKEIKKFETDTRISIAFWIENKTLEKLKEKASKYNTDVDTIILTYFQQYVFEHGM
ncbi:MAG: hypothetical protein J6J11_00210 [Treponema sp.]|nr:hypothetical protein [Clostridia bacterium]MBP3606734.1 hypothetical protein [Treponema sp.]